MGSPAAPPNTRAPGSLCLHFPGSELWQWRGWEPGLVLLAQQGDIQKGISMAGDCDKVDGEETEDLFVCFASFF